MNLVKQYTKFREEYNFKCEPVTKDGEKIYFKNQLIEDENKKYCLVMSL